MKSKTTKRRIINHSLTDKKSRGAAKSAQENSDTSDSDTSLCLSAGVPDHANRSKARVDFIINTELESFFDINVNPEQMAEHRWRLGHKAFKVPRRLRHTLHDLWASHYCVVETRSRVSTEDMLFQCCRALQNKLGRGPKDKTTVALEFPELGGPNSYGMTLFPGLDVSVEAIERISKRPAFVRASADWVFGYGPQHYADGNIVVVVQAKEPSEFSMGEMELLTCLAIIHEHRRKAGKIKRDIPGFCTDGKSYIFMCIRSDGVVVQSSYYNILNDSDLVVVFNFITTLFENACTVHPTIPK